MVQNNNKSTLTPIYTSENIQELAPNEIFVFGSNMAGRHGAGAAKLALDKFGALWGKGIGFAGQSYALPTKDILLDVRSLKDIQNSVDHLKEDILSNPDKFFWITKIGCGLAGYTNEEIAPLFKGFEDIENCALPYEFVTIINKI